MPIIWGGRQINQGQLQVTALINFFEFIKVNWKNYKFLKYKYVYGNYATCQIWSARQELKEKVIWRFQNNQHTLNSLNLVDQEVAVLRIERSPQYQTSTSKQLLWSEEKLEEVAKPPKSPHVMPVNRPT